MLYKVTLVDLGAICRYKRSVISMNVYSDRHCE